ncbi:MAG: glycosyltransferase family 4 protein [Steroidobacteraceae bacterium]|nr:glycosyltransferase family 4 protein [Steroidobacteraceae bacterium]
MKVVAIVAKYARADGRREIGGVETYMSQLARALRRSGEFLVYQPASEGFEHEFEDLTAVGHPVDGFRSLVDHVVRRVLGDGDVLLFSSEQLGVASEWKRSVVIQHGIYWDLPVEYYSASPLARGLSGCYKLFDNWRNLRRIRSHRNVVCVDYAYSTWLRSITNFRNSERRIWIVPNNAGADFFEVGEPPRSGPVSILFARRFMRFRGTRLFANVAARLRGEYEHVRFTLCGEGPDSEIMQQILPPSRRVRYCRVDHNDMPALLGEHHIVVVPSLGSEGTSLSAIEGLAAGRAVVASAVGGIPNIILDGFNGLLVPPGDEQQLYIALRSLIESPELRAQLGRASRDASRAQLGFDAWASRWRSVIDQVTADP